MSAEKPTTQETTIVQHDGSRTTLMKNGNSWKMKGEELGQYPADFQIGSQLSSTPINELEDLNDLFRAAHGLTD